MATSSGFSLFLKVVDALMATRSGFSCSFTCGCCSFGCCLPTWASCSLHCYCCIPTVSSCSHTIVGCCIPIVAHLLPNMRAFSFALTSFYSGVVLPKFKLLERGTWASTSATIYMCNLHFLHICKRPSAIKDCSFLSLNLPLDPHDVCICYYSCLLCGLGFLLLPFDFPFFVCYFFWHRFLT